MLFDRFIFVLYVLFHYAWFLLGTLYQQELRYCSLVSLACSLLVVIVISLFQLQTIVKQQTLETSDKWSGISWSIVHMTICIIFIVDGLEWANPLVVFGIAGLLMSVVIVVVGGCACFVIMQNGTDWHAHVHLTCVSFWIIIQYMILRMPEIQFQYITVIPIALMTLVRITEAGISKKELCGWFLCCLMHVFYDIRWFSPQLFFWTIVGIIMLMVFQNAKTILLITILPFALLAIAIYVCIKSMQRHPLNILSDNIYHMYNDMIPDDSLAVLPFDFTNDEDNWDERL